MRSSLGFHTMKLSMYLIKTDQLLEDFKKYSKQTRSIQIYPDKNGDTIIRFFPKDNGIKWSICHNVWINKMNGSVDIINVTINPKILSGTTDYITAATYHDLNVAITNFNSISKQISPLLNTFDFYTLNRIDYCINFDLNELIGEHDPELIMNLIGRSDIPRYYKKWSEYDNIAHRQKSKPGSFYLINESVNVNCYSKYMQLQARSQENMERGYPPISQEIMDGARSIIRFEIQCKYHKTYALSNMAQKSGNLDCNKYKSLLAPDKCNQIIEYYFNRIIGKGDWYTLHEAIQIIKSHGYNSQHKKRLIDALQLVSQCRSVAKAKTFYHGNELESFKRTLKELSILEINPVTIPREWDIKHIPNLLRVYNSKMYDEWSMSFCQLLTSKELRQLYKKP